MTRLTTLDGIKKGDKLLEFETVQGLNGQVVGAFAYPLTVVKVTKTKVHVNNDYFNCGYAFRRDENWKAREFYYGKKVELYIAEENEALPEMRPVLQP